MKCFLFLFIFIAALSFTTSYTEAQTMFLANFENTSGPNDPQAWNAGAQTKGLVNFGHVEHAGSGRLIQTLNTNANTTTTVAPTPAGSKNWTDYTVQMTVTYDDNDTWWLVFRYTDADHYYMFGVTEGTLIGHLWKAPAVDGSGADAGNGTPVGPDTPVPGLVIRQGGKPIIEGTLNAPVETTEWVVRAVVEKDIVKCYFFSRKDIKKLDDPAPGPPIFEVKDTSNPKGCVGIRNDSNVGTIDDFAVYGADGIIAVDMKEKLATTWGIIKTM